MTRAHIVTLFAALISGCAPQWTWTRDTGSSVPTTYVCLPDEIAAQAEPAITAWDYSLREWHHVRVGCPGTITVTVVAPGGPECSSDTALACASDLGGNQIYLRRGRFENDLPAILAHELGHVFGAQHTSSGLMASSYNHAHPCPDEQTVLQVAAYNHIDATRLRYCY